MQQSPEAANLFQEVGDDRGAALAFYNHGSMYHSLYVQTNPEDRSLLEKASYFYQVAWDSFRRLENYETESGYRSLFANMASVLLEYDERQRAAELFLRAINLGQQYGASSEELSIAQKGLKEAQDS